MSSWCFDNDGGKSPVSFSELAALVAKGKVTADTQVWDATNPEHPQRADAVVGLMRAARTLRAEAKADPELRKRKPVDHSRSESAAGTTNGGGKGDTLGTKLSPKRTAVLSAIGLVGVWTVWSWLAQRRRFPTPSWVEDQPIQWWLPIVGETSALAFFVILLDVVVVVGVVVWRFQRTNTKTKSAE